MFWRVKISLNSVGNPIYSSVFSMAYIFGISKEKPSNWSLATEQTFSRSRFKAMCWGVHWARESYLGHTDLAKFLLGTVYPGRTIDSQSWTVP